MSDYGFLSLHIDHILVTQRKQKCQPVFTEPFHNYWGCSVLASSTLFTTSLSHKKGTEAQGQSIICWCKTIVQVLLLLKAVWPHGNWVLGTGLTLHWLPNYFCRLFGKVLVGQRQNCMRDHSKICTIQRNHIPGPGYNFWQFSGTVQFTIIYSAFKYYERKVICPVTAINPHVSGPFTLLQAVGKISLLLSPLQAQERFISSCWRQVLDGFSIKFWDPVVHLIIHYWLLIY